jgi:DNA-binding response OmpR family regulator
MTKWGMAGIDVLVVDDAPEFVELAAVVLAQAGHRVRRASSVAEALEAIDHSMPDLVVLDLTLPDGDGLDLCRTVRERGDAYVLVVTGRPDAGDRLMGFRLGADDVLTKPFSGRELNARVDALLRRPRGAAAAGTAAIRVFGNVRIDTDSHEVTVAGELVKLTRIEYALLDRLSVNPRAAVSRSDLMVAVWGDAEGDDHLVDVHMANLRRKVDLPGLPSCVVTVRGVGYRMAG